MTVEDIALTMTPSLGVKGIVHLLDVFGDAHSVFAVSTAALVAEAGLRADVARNIVGRGSHKKAEREMEYCAANAIVAVASTDALYPPLLRDTCDYPHILYIKGDPAALSRRCVSMVGTRGVTAYGREMCSRLVGGLAGRVSELVVVSGLATGTDAECHHAALSYKVPTVGVIANALPCIMPALNSRLANEMAGSGGAVVTEINSQMPQNGKYYVQRNRIIAGLSAGTVVVESPLTGGSLITASQAFGYNRTVMALPGRATDRASDGPNYLIRNHTAQAVVSGEDIARELMWEFSIPSAAETEAAQQRFTADEMRLLACFPDSDPVRTEQLAEASGFETGRLMELLMMLELSSAVRMMPGGAYMKRARA